MTRMLCIAIILINIVFFFIEIFYFPFTLPENVLILSILTLGQSFMNALFALLCIIIKYITKTQATKENLSKIINAFWISTGLSLLLAVGYCFIGGPFSRVKTSNIMS